jgi:hypothetical protein
MRVEVDGVDTPIYVNSMSLDNAVGQRSTAQLTLRDDDAENHYEDGQRVDVFDDEQDDLLIFSGVMDGDDEEALEPNGGLRHKVALKDWHYLADKRLVAATYDAGETAGDVASDIVAGWLAEEGVVGTTTQPAFARASTAYKLDGTSVSSDAPRYETGDIAGSKAVRVEEGTTNLLSANQSSVETDTTGFSASASALLATGASISRVTTEHWSGAASLQVVTTNANAGEGAETTAIAASANTKHSAQARVKGTAGKVVTLALRDFTNSVVGSTDLTLTGGWDRVTVTITTGASAVTDLRMCVKSKNAEVLTFYVDGWQIEAKGHATQWQIGGTPRAAETLKLPGKGNVRPDEGTLQFRAYVDATVRREESGNFPNFFGVNKDGGGGGLSLFHSDGSANWVVNIAGAKFPSFADSSTPDGWHKFVVAWDSASLLVYVDGTLRCTENNPPLPAAFDEFFYIGSNGSGGDHINTLYQDWLFSPRKLSATEIAADAALTDFLTLDDGANYRATLDNALTATHHIANGAMLPDVVFDYATAADCSDALAKKSGAYWWQIDQYRQFWFQPYAGIPAPWNLTSDVNGVVTDARRGTVRVKRAKPKYRNVQYIRDIKGQTDPQIETRIGDGTNRAFVMSFPLHAVPTVEVNIASGGYVAQTVGIGGSDSGKDWYWNGGKNEVSQDSGGTPLTSSDILRVTYVGEFPLIVISEDNAEITLQQMLEGGGTSGKVESIVSDASLTTSDAAFAEAAALLAKYAQNATQLRFQTRRAGLKPGQLIHVTIPRHGLNDDMLIESVHIGDEQGQIIWYDVSAILGPINTSWEQFFGALVKDASSSGDTLQVGSSSTLALTESFTGSISVTGSFVATVYACPLLGTSVFPLTLC